MARPTTTSRRSKSATAALAGTSLLGLLSSCATMPRAQDEGGTAWVRAETLHIVLETDIDAHEARVLGRDLETWRSVLTVALFPGDESEPQRLCVITLGAHELEVLNPLLHGLFVDNPYLGPTLLLGASTTSDRQRVMKHELVHAVIAEHLYDPPQWVTEGLAVYLETTELDETTGHVSWGRLPTPGPFDAPTKPVTLERILDPRPWPVAERGDLERGAGFLVHTLAHRHAVALRCLLRRLSHSEELPSSLDLCFGPKRRWRQDEARERGDSGKALGTARVAPYRGEPRLSLLPEADVHTLLAMTDLGVSATFPADSGPRDELVATSERHFRRALALDPNQLVAASMALAPLAPGGDPGGELTARLVLAHPDDWRAWHWRAAVFSTRSADVRKALAKASALAPNRPDVLQLLAQDAIRSGRWDDAATLTMRAYHLWPSSSVTRTLMVTVLAHLGPRSDHETLVGSDDDVANAIKGILRTSASVASLPASLARFDAP